MMGNDLWQPIETVTPHHLVDIWIKNSIGGMRWTDCHYDRICDEWRKIGPTGKLLSINAENVTHWMLIPPPPQSNEVV